MSAGRRVTDGPHLLLLNTYSMREVQSRVAAGEFPGQHLWGAAHASEGWRVATAPRTSVEALPRWFYRGIVKRIVEGAFGDIVQQLWALRFARRGDAIYAATQGAAPLLATLRRVRLLPVPIIVLVHNDLRSSLRGWVKGADAVLVFSETVKGRLITRGVSADKIHIAPWGPDLESEVYRRVQGVAVARDFASIGKDNRDFGELTAAAASGAIDGVIADGRTATAYANGVPTQIREGRMPYMQCLELLASARVAAIPVANHDRLTGLTELNDALALRKPIVMTHVDFLPFDIEAEGVGAWVEPGADAAEWARAISALEPNDSAFTRLLGKHNDVAMGDLVFTLANRTLSATKTAGSEHERGQRSLRNGDTEESNPVVPAGRPLWLGRTRTRQPTD